MRELVGRNVMQVRLCALQGVLAFDHPDGKSSAFCFVERSVRDGFSARITGIRSNIGFGMRLVEEIRIEQTRDDGSGDERTSRPLGWRLHSALGFADIIIATCRPGCWIESFQETLPDAMAALIDNDYTP